MENRLDKRRDPRIFLSKDNLERPLGNPMLFPFYCRPFSKPNLMLQDRGDFRKGNGFKQNTLEF